MSKRPYQAVEIKDVAIEHVVEQFDYQEVTVGVDVAKEDVYGCLMGPHWEIYYVFKFNGRREVGEFIHLLEALQAEEVTVITEPSANYGRPLRKAVREAGFQTRKMPPEKCSDSASLFDDVPSMHDGKAAYQLARLHLIEVSQQWKELDERQRTMRSLLRRQGRKEKIQGQYRSYVEDWLATHWPELTLHLGLSSATLHELLKYFGSPQAVAAQPQRARRLMGEVSRGMLSEQSIEAVVESARQTRGIVPNATESEEIRENATKFRQLAFEINQVKRQLKEASKEEETTQRLTAFGGLRFAAAAVALVGDPNDYGSAGQYRKAAGLNLKERSSGKHKGELKITKRGPGAVRKYLFLLACRMVRGGGCPYVQAWYAERLKRNGKNRMKGLVAVMRKLIAAAYHVGRGEEYDPTKLFDVSRLDVAA